MLTRVLSLFVLGTTCAMAAPTLEGPANGSIGSEITVTVTGNPNPRDFVTIVPKGSAEGKYDTYAYANKPGPLKLTLPLEPGEYELRLLAADSPYPTLVRRPFRIDNVTATLDGPTEVAAGAKFEVRWTGPKNARDYVAIGEADPKGRPYITYVYAKEGSPISLVAPDEAGAYELRYFLGYGDKIIASRPIRVGSVGASVSAPATAAAGSTINVTWKGPNNPRDFLTIVKADTPEKQYGPYEYTAKGTTVPLRVPDAAGEYEVRYLTAQSYLTLGKTKLTVTATNASLQAPGEAVAGSTFSVSWKGPDNPFDYVTVLPPDAHEGSSGPYQYTKVGNPMKLMAPTAPGAYELRYAMGQSHRTLARVPIRITPAKLEPGKVSVTAASGVATAGAVEIILDASGSMLQRIGGQRRIDIARQTLTKLATKTIPAGTPFAMRVFGREVDSCQTDLEIPLAPLDGAAVTAKIAKLESKNNARTPIGASLDKVAEDLRTAGKDRLVILLTDGEETCGGDPAAAIAKLKAAGVNVRVNIVGFALDDPRLVATFRHWADLGGGAYFDAQDASGLDKALSQATQSGFAIVDAQNQVVAEGTVGGDAVSVMPGSYTVRLKGAKGPSQPVTVTPKETSAVRF